MTTDVWVRKGSGRYHAGLDIGDDDGGGGEHILAAEAGILRTYWLNDKEWLVYCPTPSLPFDEQFYISEKPWSHAVEGGMTFSDCGYIASTLSGWTAIIFHGEAFGRQHLTKYSHLQGLAPRVEDELNDTIRGSDSMIVAKGEHIGFEGSTGSGGNHLHFEMRAFKSGVSPSHDWYKSTRMSCGSDITTNGYCGWKPGRSMETVIDPEVLLSPPPASRTEQSPVGGVVDKGRPFEITGVSVADATSSSRTSEITVKAAIWRPQFYTWVPPSDDPDWPNLGSMKHRINTEGVRGTRPGVTRYQVVVDCAPSMSRYATGNPGRHGETPPVTVTVGLALGNECELEVKSLNETYRVTVPFTNAPYGKASDGRPIQPVVPRAKVTWIADLPARTNAVRAGESLRGDDLDLYTFTAYAGHSYAFCTYPPMQSPAPGDCGSEAADTVAQLLIFGPTGKVMESATMGNSNQLSWKEPTDGPRKTTYTLVVRRRDRVEGSVTPYNYTLRYTIPTIHRCTVVNFAPGNRITICIPVKPAPSVSSRTHNTVTVSWARPDGALSYETKRTTDENCAAEDEDIVKQFKPHSANTADGVSGTGNQDVRYPFPGLTASTNYTLCVRSVRTIETGFVLKSDWASVSATTRAEQLPKPSGLSVTNIGQTSMTLNWSAVAGAGGYKVKRTGSSSTWTLPSTSRSHRFSGLRSGTYYTLSVQALPASGSSKVASDWTPRTRRTDSSPPITITPPPIDCLGSKGVGQTTYTSGCGSVPVSSLLTAVQGVNSAICAIRLWEDDERKWVIYGRSNGRLIPGSVNFWINPGAVLWLSTCTVAGDGVSGASDVEPPNCPDAVKPESGPAVIDADASSCTAVRGAGALQISRGEYTLNITLASDRDWFAFASANYAGSSAGAFLFLDLTTGGWIALYPPDGSELDRHTPTDAPTFPALLDAIAASASPPATE